MQETFCSKFIHFPVLLSHLDSERTILDMNLIIIMIIILTIIIEIMIIMMIMMTIIVILINYDNNSDNNNNNNNTNINNSFCRWQIFLTVVLKFSRAHLKRLELSCNI